MSKQRYSLVIDSDLLCTLQTITQRDGISTSEQIRRGIKLWIKRNHILEDEEKEDNKEKDKSTLMAFPVLLSLRISKEMEKQIREAAQQDDRTIGNFVRRLLSKALLDYQKETQNTNGGT